MSKFKTFSDAMSAAPRVAAPRVATPKAANDNKPRKTPEPRYRGTLPALRWLYDNHPELAGAVADAVQSLTKTLWDTEATDNEHVFTPTIGEIVKAAADGKQEDGTPNWMKPTVEADRDGNPYVALGKLKFVRGELVEFGRTTKGKKLQPRERIVSRADEPSKSRNPNAYVFHTGGTPSPLHAESYQRPFSGESALVPMYDPQKGVEANRTTLREFGVDGSVAFEDLPFQATRCPTVIAKGAEFLGGVVQSSGNSSSGAIMWEAPEVKMGEARRIVEEVAAGATLTDIGERLGLKGGYAIRTAGDALVDAAKAILAANDNRRRKIAA